MELQTRTNPMTVLTGHEAGVELSAGDKLRIQTQVGGETIDILPLTSCPNGKTWLVNFNVEIIEESA